MQVKENGENHFIHTPAATYPSKKEWSDNLQAESHEKLHNTDPLFFGTRFYYANCLQFSKGCDHLREIPDGSLILFGEHGDESRRLFRIECVFHVSHSLSYSPEKLVEEPQGGLIDCDNARPSRREINRPFKAQPEIDLAGFGLSQNSQHAAARHTFTEPGLELYFRCIAKTIVKQGFALGISAVFL